MWRRLLSKGPEKFGEVYYLGHAPGSHDGVVLDVLVGTHDVVETRFLFDQDHPRLVALEMFPDRDVDPCELYFEDYRPLNGRQLPHRIRVVHGDADFGTMRLSRIGLGAQSPEGTPRP
jgi:hypothetical protein